VSHRVASVRYRTGTELGPVVELLEDSGRNMGHPSGNLIRILLKKSELPIPAEPHVHESVVKRKFSAKICLT
jgi:hypothetical protein